MDMVRGRYRSPDFARVIRRIKCRKALKIASFGFSVLFIVLDMVSG